MSGGPVKSPVESLRNTRRSIGDGTLGGRSRIATPYRPDRLRNAVRAVSSSSAIPQGELLALSATAITIDGGGTDVVDDAEAVDAQSGFTSVDAAGDVPSLPLLAAYVAEVDVRWTDGYRGGGMIVVDLDGTAIEEVWPTPHTSEPWGRWVDQVTFAGLRGETFGVTVTPADGASHTADVTVRLAVVEPLRTIVESINTGVYIAGSQFAGGSFTYEQVVWHQPQGSTTWDTVAVPAAIEPDQTDFAAAGCFCGPAIILVGGNGNFWRTTTNPPTSASDWTLVLDSTTSGGLSTENNGISSDGVSKVRVIEPDAADTSELWESNDGGATWSEQREFGVRYDFIAYNNFGTWVILGSHTAKSGKSPYGNLAISSDGDTWTTVTMPNVTDGKYAAAVGSDSDVIVLSQVNQVTDPDTADGYLTTDGGSNWSTVDLSIGDGNDEGTQTAFTNKDGDVCLVGTDNKVYTYSGGSWDAGVSLPSTTSPFYIGTAIAADGQISLVNSTDVAHVSDDNGATWAETSFDDDTVSAGQTTAGGVFRNGWQGA